MRLVNRLGELLMRAPKPMKKSGGQGEKRRVERSFDVVQYRTLKEETSMANPGSDETLPHIRRVRMKHRMRQRSQDPGPIGIKSIKRIYIHDDKTSSGPDPRRSTSSTERPRQRRLQPISSLELQKIFSKYKPPNLVHKSLRVNSTFA